MRVHGDHGWKSLHLKFPNRFGRTEFFQEINIRHTPDTLGKNLRCATYRMQVDTSVLAAGFEGAVSHPAFTDDTSEAEIADNLALIRLFAN